MEAILHLLPLSVFLEVFISLEFFAVLHKIIINIIKSLTYLIGRAYSSRRSRWKDLSKD